MERLTTACMAALLLASLAREQVIAVVDHPPVRAEEAAPDPFAPPPSTTGLPAVSDLASDDHSEMAEHLRQAWSAGRSAPLPFSGETFKDPLARQSFGVALYHYWAAIRATDLASTKAHLLMVLPKPTMDWTDVAAGLHEEKTFRATVIEQLAKCPDRKASWQTTRWIQAMMASRCWTGQRHDQWALMNLIITRQPHMLYLLNWKTVVQDLDESGMHEEAGTLAQAIITAPEPAPEAMLITANDPIASDPIAMRDVEYSDQMLEFALAKEPEKFISKLHEGARPGVWRQIDEYWLTAKMRTGSLTAEDLELVKSWTPQHKLLRAFDLMLKAPQSPAREILQPWINEGLDLLFSRKFFEDYPTSSYAVQQAFDHFDLLQLPATRDFVRTHLPSWLDWPEGDAESFYPPIHHELLSRLAFACGTPEDQEKVLQLWMQRSRRWLESISGFQAELYVEPFADLSRRVPAPHAARLADFAGELLLERYHNLGEGPTNPNVKVARAVLCALLATDQRSKLGWLSSELERVAIRGRPNENYNPDLISLLIEMRSLVGALLHRPDYMPQVVAWTRNGKTASDPPEIVWEFVAPLFDPATLPEGDILRVAARFTPSWRVTMGLRSPLLEALAGYYDVSFETGESITALKPAAAVPLAAAHGTVTMTSAPPLSGYLRATLQDRVTGRQSISPPRPYSLEPPVLSTGVAPTGPCASPWLAGPQSSWIGCKPANSASADATPLDTGIPASNLVPIDQDQTYLLTIWNSWEVQPDGADGATPELHDLSIVFLSEDQTTQSAMDIDISQVARSSKFHVGSPLYQADLFFPARYATGTVEFAGQTVPAKVRSVMMVGARTRNPSAWPLFQLRPIHLPKEPKPGSEK